MHSVRFSATLDVLSTPRTLLERQDLEPHREHIKDRAGKLEERFGELREHMAKLKWLLEGQREALSGRHAA